MNNIKHGVAFEINSSDIQAEQVFTGKSDILVYVEGFEDVKFWHKAFSIGGLENVTVVEISKDHIANGKARIISKIENGEIILGPSLLVALDSDYDYLKEINQNIFSSDYCFQTYCYSIENYIYNPHDLLLECSYATNCCEFKDQHRCFGDLLEHWSFDNSQNFEKYLNDNCEKSIDAILGSLAELNFDYYAENIDESDEALISPYDKKGVSRKNIHFFVRGHDLERQMIRLGEQYTEKVLELKKEQIKNSGLEKDAQGQRIQEFINARVHFKQALKSRSFEHIHMYEKILEDINSFSQNYK